MKVSRRTFLRGLGAAVALPALEGVPGVARAASASPRRLLVVHLPNGMWMPDFTPSGTGTAWTPSPVLQPLARHQADLNVISGLRNLDLRDEADDHGSLMAALLTGDPNILGTVSSATGGVSVDQMVALAQGDATPFASLELASEGTVPCYDIPDCVYRQNVSWQAPTTPVPREFNPLALFERLFGSADPAVTAADRKARQARDLLVVDAVLEDAASLSAKLGRADQLRLDAFTTSLFEVERALRTGDVPQACQPAVDDLSASGALVPPFPVEQHTELMTELLALAVHCDLTRVASWQIANEVSRRQFPWLGVDFQHHATSHHLGRADRKADLRKIGRWEMELVASLLDKLAALREPDGSRVLDHSLVLVAGSMGDPDPHDPENLPVLVAGQAGGAITTGRHVAYPGRPFADLLLTITGAMGLDAITSYGLEGTSPIDLS